jgi:hypothetical protein
LENLILSFAQQKKQEDESGSGSSGSNSGGAARGSSASASSTSPANNLNNSAEPSPATSGLADQSTSVESDPGKLLKNGTMYVDASNWQAILDDVCHLIEFLGRD